MAYQLLTRQYKREKTVLVLTSPQSFQEPIEDTTENATVLQGIEKIPHNEFRIIFATYKE